MIRETITFSFDDEDQQKLFHERLRKGPDMSALVERLRDVRCDREAFTSDHVQCICRLANEAADEIERLKRPCACHPDDNPPTPCPRKFAISECRAAARPTLDDLREEDAPGTLARERLDRAVDGLIMAAVAVEREACAKLVHDRLGADGYGVAQLIRARGKGS